MIQVHVHRSSKLAGTVCLLNNRTVSILVAQMEFNNEIITIRHLYSTVSQWFNSALEI